MRHRLSLLGSAIAVAAITTSTPLAAQKLFPSDSVVKSILEKRVQTKRTFGVVVGLLDVDGSRRVLAAGSSGANGVPLDGNTVFEIGSITKTFTTTLLADMVLKGEVRLDDPVQKFLPGSVKVPARNGKQITLVDLATQSSGLPRMPTNFKPKDPGNPYPDYGATAMYEFLNGYTLPRDIGEKYEYSNLGMGLLGDALALELGKGYEEAVLERVIRPLGMNDTRITLTPDLERRLAPGHDQQLRQVPNWDFDAIAPAGAIRSTVNDMFKYLAANLDSTSRPLGRALALAHQSRREAGTPTMTIGLAWHILKAPGGGSITWHNGGTGGYRTFTGFDLAKHIGVVVLTNSAIGADDIGFHLLDSLVPLTKPPQAHHEITVAREVLAPYVGVYEIAPNFALTVTLEGDTLWMQPTGQGKVRAHPESDHEFFITEADVQIIFVKDANGQVTGLVLRQSGQDAPGKKVK